MKPYITFLFILFSFLSATAKIREVVVIDSAQIKVVYKRTTVTDTLHPKEKFKTDNLTLFAGKKGTAFYCVETRIHEEAMQNGEYILKLLENPENFNTQAALTNDALFRNYEDNKSIENLRYDLAEWQYQEEIEKPQWTIGDSVQNILGYDCIMATTDFRGRRWIAFFAPEIPLTEGPWKLCGLPGMILNAHDEKNHYIYEAIGLETENAGNVEYFNYSDRYYVKNRKKGLQYRRKTLNLDIAAKIRAKTGLDLPSNPNLLEEEKKNYDFEETDYPHE